MLTEAQIEIVDDAGQVEDRVRIVGAGEVAVATKGTPHLQLPSDDPTDIEAVIRLRDGAVTIEARKHQALRVDDEFLRVAEPYAAQRAAIAFLAAVNRRLRVRTVQVPTASLMSPGGLVIREEPSELERQAAAAAAKGIVKVREHLTRLRERGLIDDRGEILVPLPEEMSPDSKTDVESL